MIKRNESIEGISIEDAIKRMKLGEAIEMNSKPEIFHAKNEGVKIEFNIRTDRFEIMQDMQDKIARTYVAKRAEIDKKEIETLSESIQAETSES